MKKIIAIFLIFSIFIGYSTKTNAKDDKEVIRKTTYTKDGGVYRLFLGVRYKEVNTTYSIRKLDNTVIHEYHVECLKGGWEKCRRGPTEYSPSYNISGDLTTLLDNTEDQMLTNIEEQIQNGMANGSMTKKIVTKDCGTSKTYQITIEWRDCDNKNNGGTIISTISDITKHLPCTSTNVTSNSALSH